MSTWRFDSSHIFLTYSQANGLEKEVIVTHLNSLCSFEWLRICKEQHQDGGIHFHAVGKFTRRYTTRNSRAFDIGEFHPNIQPVRSVTRALEYVSKDGEFWDQGPVPAGGDSSIDWVAAATSMGESEYYHMAMRSKIGYMYAKQFWDIAKRKKTSEIDETYEADPTRESMLLQFYVPSETQSTVICGPSGIGKTSWAKRVAKKPALWVRHMDVLRALRPGYHQSIIFDDMSFLHLPREAQIHIVDMSDEAHIHCRYGHATIPAGLQKIFTANIYPFILDPAIERRVYKIQL